MGEARRSDPGRPLVCLVCSSGGHFAELRRLQRSWQHCDEVWVTFDSEDTRTLLEGKRVIHAFAPTNRNVLNLLRNTWLAWRVLSRERPDAIITTGAGVAVPFLLVARLRGVTGVFIETLSRVDDLSLTGKISYRLAHEFLVQWPGLVERYPRARYEGRVLCASS